MKIVKECVSMNNAKAIRLVDYLIRLASLRVKIIRDLEEYSNVLWIHDIPEDKGCFTRAWRANEEYDQDIWVEIQSSLEPEIPRIPEICKEWVDQDSVKNTNDLPNLLETIQRKVENSKFRERIDQPRYIIKSEQLIDYPEVIKAWEKYIDQQWLPWAEQYDKWAKVHRVYSILFSIYQEQLRLGEEYELVLGFGLLIWQTPSNQRVFRHLVVANALLEFEARLGKFTIRPSPDGANLRPELDMFDLEEQPIHTEEEAKEKLKNVNEDPWDKSCIEDVLKALVHSINPNGAYYSCLDSERGTISQKPIVRYAPAIILRKRSVKCLTDILKRIRERIENEEGIPNEFGDLAEITTNDEEYLKDGWDNSNIKEENIIYFPKPSNEEQRRIVEKIRTASGVLVQGPPGTGKSHTIANLICHLLATGQRTLITAKTPRALQVLNSLIPEELRPLCINLLGSGLEEKRSLEASVNAILQKNQQWNELFTPSEIKNREGRLNELWEEKTEIVNRLRAIRESEAHVQTIADGKYRGTASQIAQILYRDKAKYDWFNDKVLFNENYSFSDINFTRLIKELRWFTPEKRREMHMLLPEKVTEVERFKKLLENERIAYERKKNTSSNIDKKIFELISALSPEMVRIICINFEQLINEIARLRSISYSWIPTAIKDILSGNIALWQELYRVSEQIILSVSDSIQEVDSIDIVLPDTEKQKKILEDASELKKYLDDGGKLGWGPFRPKFVKSVKYILHDIKINGRTCNDIEHISQLIDMLRVRIELGKGWDYWRGRLEKTEGPYSMQFQALKSQKEVLSKIIALTERINSCRDAFSKCGSFQEPVWYDDSCLESILKVCVYYLAAEEANQATIEIDKLGIPLTALIANGNIHPATRNLLNAIRERNFEVYAQAISRIESLKKEKESAFRVAQTLKKISERAPRLAENLSLNSTDICWDYRIRILYEAWCWAQARTWLEEYINKEDAPSLARRLLQLEDEIGKEIAHIASLRAWSFCFSRMQEDHRRHMEAWQQSMRRLGKGTGRHAPRHRREAQKHLNACREAVPAWIMPLHRVWDTVDPAPGMFDVIIVDEASQCGFEALPLLYLGKKILIVGDDKQISPDAVGISRDAVNRLMEEYLYDYNFKTTFDVDGSLFDHGKLRYGTRRIALREHFRCMPEIIRFSNSLCYSDTPLIPLRQYPPDRLIPLEHIYIANGYREGSLSHVINRPEAKAIVEKIVELCNDKRYGKKTMGVIVLQGEAQAKLIEDQLLEKIGAEEMDKRRLICGNPYSFQGDERDILFLSMVAAPNERIGPLTMSADERRFNVAASRARDQMWLFHSVTCDDLSNSCLRRQLLEFFQETKPREIAGIDIEKITILSEQANRNIENPPQPFDSWFEVDVALEIARKNYRVVPQFEVAGKRIDIVVEGGDARIAVECDGDEFHGVEQYENDMQRQRMLERCGWFFYRIRASSFYADRDGALKRLWVVLNERGIYPITSTSSDNIGHDSTSNEEKKENTNNTIKNEEKEIIEVGDTVTYIFENDPISERQARLTRGKSNPDWGEMNVDAPIAKALLGASKGEVVNAKLPKGIMKIRIVKIIKG